MSPFSSRSSASDVLRGVDLHGRTYLVTGANSGLGLETVRALRAAGASVIGAARTADKARAAFNEAGVEGATGIGLELADLASVRACVDELARENVKLDAVLCNAGIMALPKLELVQGVERQFFTNHVGHFTLVMGILERGLLKDDGRVVMTSSDAHAYGQKKGLDVSNLDYHQGNYGPWLAYGNSKQANILFAKALQRRVFAGSNRRAVSLHPGVIATNLQRSMPWIMQVIFSNIIGPFFLKNVGQGAATQVFLATRDYEMQARGYWADCNPAKCLSAMESVELQDAVWEATEKLCKL